MIRICKILEPFGIKGILKVLSFCELPIDSYNPLTIEKSEVEVFLKIHSKKPNNVFMVSFAGFLDRTSVDPFVGKYLTLKKNKLPILKDNEHYYNDIVGLKVSDTTGNSIGVVSGIYNFGAGDFIDINSDKVFTYLFKDIITIDKEKIIIDKNFLIS